MRVVLDTNVLLSGLMLPESVPGRIVQAWREARYELVLSEPLLEEIARALAYPKISARLKWDEATIARFILLLKFKSVIADIHDVKVETPRDKDDEHVLSTLIAGKAECLVTGDADLLSLNAKYPIITPAEFARRL
ncbi:MAG: putative toxin-antitoxin system toxin component, PIN family [Gammaproteobacteria bacterium]|nr:putative toxin-antitoxin system toxin component, PIN family [Gammaproteobacteria bacterium]